jgi:hypothetical protein
MAKLDFHILLLIAALQSCGSQNADTKKFPVPRHILVDSSASAAPNSSTGHDDASTTSGRGLPLVSFAAELSPIPDPASREEQAGPGEEPLLETTTVPESLGLHSNPNLCTQPARCEPLPPNATWYCVHIFIQIRGSKGDSLTGKTNRPVSSIQVYA